MMMNKYEEYYLVKKMKRFLLSIKISHKSQKFRANLCCLGGGAKSFLKTLSKPKPLERGLFMSNAVATFDRADGSSIMLTGKSRGKVS